MQHSQQKSPIPTWLRSRLASFSYAFIGVAVLLRTQIHAKIHFAATIFVIVLGWYYNVSRLEWIALCGAIGLVWVTEALNTAIEFVVDLVHPKWHEDAGKIKDVAAGAVLLAAFTALAIGILVFSPYLGF